MPLVDRLIHTSLPLVPRPLVRAVSRPYIAGEALGDFVTAARRLNEQGLMAAAGILGEFVERRSEAEAAVREYEAVLATIADQQLDADIHVKLTHLGLKLDREFCDQNIRRLVQSARDRSNFVRIDMEDSTCTDDTLEMYERLHAEFDNVGTVIQASMRRSLDDVRRLKGKQANIRLCKGIYIEPRAIAYWSRDIVQGNFTWLLEELFDGGCYVGIATHDERLVWDAFRLIDRLGIDRNCYEFQMLLGVEPSLRRIITGAGHRLRVAVPFGSNWYPYSVRRLRKNPALARHVVRAMFSGERWREPSRPVVDVGRGREAGFDRPGRRRRDGSR